MTSAWIVLGPTTRISLRETHIKGDMENADPTTVQLPATHATSESSVQFHRSAKSSNVLNKEKYL